MQRIDTRWGFLHHVLHHVIPLQPREAQEHVLERRLRDAEINDVQLRRALVEQLEDRGQVGVSAVRKRRSLCEVFPMFVPSLSW